MVEQAKTSYGELVVMDWGDTRIGETHSWWPDTCLDRQRSALWATHTQTRAVGNTRPVGDIFLEDTCSVNKTRVGAKYA